MKTIVAITVFAIAAITVAYAADKPNAGAQATCGQMTAERAAIPAKMAETVISIADAFDAHAAFMATMKNKEATTEIDGLRKLAQQYRDLGAMLTKTADMTRTAATWPAVPHDMAKMMADAKIKETTKKMLLNQKEVAAMIQKEVAQAETMGPKK